MAIILKSCVYKDLSLIHIWRRTYTLFRHVQARLKNDVSRKEMMKCTYPSVGFFEGLVVRGFFIHNFSSVVHGYKLFLLQKGRFQIRIQKSKMVTGFCFGTCQTSSVYFG